MYFNKEFLDLSEDECLLDIGALNGDSSIDFIINTDYKFEHIYVIEPEADEIKKCYDTLFNLMTKDKITFYNIGIADKNTLVTYRNNHGSLQYVKAWKIDSIFDNKKVTIIKMDIEGMEQKALLGGKNIIKTQKPKLAVCIYHLEDDIWKIPLMVNEMNPDYKLYIRHNEDRDGEVVLYAL